MCHTTHTTHLICLHHTSDTESCRTLFASIFLKCRPTTDEVFLHDYCPRCREFWDHYSISESSSRQHAIEFRKKENYEGAMTPTVVPAGNRDRVEIVFGFMKDNEEGDGRRIAEVVREEPAYMRELNAKWGKDPSPGSNSKKPERTSSADSRVTRFPGEDDPVVKKLGPDEFGHDSDVASNWSRGEGIIRPQEIGLEALDSRLSRPDAARLKPVAPMPASTPQRGRRCMPQYQSP